MLKYIVVIMLVGMCTLQTQATEEQWHPNWLPADKIIIQGLDKVTARVFTEEIYPNQLVKFGTLEMYVRAAFKAPPEDTPESVCYLEVFENKIGESRRTVFSGWMFASSPTSHAFEHPVYDLWIKETIVHQPEPPATNPTQPEATAAQAE